MVRLRPFKDCDSQYLIKWMEDEKTFVKWCANHLEYPLTYKQCIEYKKKHDDKEESWIFPALSEEGNIIGHVLFDKMNFEVSSIHLGHIIVDSTNRGNGIGKEMLKTSLFYAFNILQVDKVTLTVFDNNDIAKSCYTNVGFNVYEYYPEYYPYKDEKWGCYFMEISRRDFVKNKS